MKISNMLCHNKIWVSVALAITLLLQSCADLTGQRSPIPVESPPVVKKKQKHHATETHVYTMRGFLGIFSRGMDKLSERCNDELQIPSMSVAALEWPKLANYIIEQKRLGELSGPLILVGHSEGADDQIEVARKLANANIQVDLLVLIGPFFPNPVPPNVKYVLNLDRSYVAGKIIPFMGNVPVRLADHTKTKMQTLDFGYTKTNIDASLINHFNIDKNYKVQNLVLAKIKEFDGDIYSTD